MARMRRNWTAEEDARLSAAVKDALAQSRPLLWRELAMLVPGRSNKDCRRRWWNTLAEHTMKGPWSREEDERLMKAVQKYGPSWAQVASDVRSRNADQCSSHWSQVLDPNINYCDWTPEEDESLLHAVLTHGTNWKTIAGHHVPKRNTLALKNRYSTLRSRHKNAKTITTTNSEQANNPDTNMSTDKYSSLPWKQTYEELPDWDDGDDDSISDDGNDDRGNAEDMCMANERRDQFETGNSLAPLSDVTHDTLQGADGMQIPWDSPGDGSAEEMYPAAGNDIHITSFLGQIPTSIDIGLQRRGKDIILTKDSLETIFNGSSAGVDPALFSPFDSMAQPLGGCSDVGEVMSSDTTSTPLSLDTSSNLDKSMNPPVIPLSLGERSGTCRVSLSMTCTRSQLDQVMVNLATLGNDMTIKIDSQ
ncbi:hypothetical protein B0I35DRAFT_436150 [Stachybotrys elegans]|uniref:Uncharacterized protein n=1 Tax=Stachybotrys elegans TaxID=80388 RepID=A0A8K0SMQ1_9HYPO|nr:hypothetical protein B0I35DRAFT_436150 [Stachybotrys elegans]